MKSLLVLMVCGLAVHATQSKVQSNFHKLVKDLAQTRQSSGHNCLSAVNRWKNEPAVDASKIIGTGTLYTDTSFPTND